MQLNLPFPDLPTNDDGLWEQLDETLREAMIKTLAQVIVKASIYRENLKPESSHERDKP